MVDGEREKFRTFAGATFKVNCDVNRCVTKIIFERAQEETHNCLTGVVFEKVTLLKFVLIKCC